MIAWMPFASSSMKEGEQRIITHPLQQRVYGTTLFPVDSSPAPSPLYPSRMSNCLPSSFATPSQGRGEEKSRIILLSIRDRLFPLFPREFPRFAVSRGRRLETKANSTRHRFVGIYFSPRYVCTLICYAFPGPMRIIQVIPAVSS